jgi:hypothetical protein
LPNSAFEAKAGAVIYASPLLAALQQYGNGHQYGMEAFWQFGHIFHKDRSFLNTCTSMHYADLRSNYQLSNG